MRDPAVIAVLSRRGGGRMMLTRRKPRRLLRRRAGARRRLARGRGGRDRRHRRRQRRRQDLAHPHHRRHASARRAAASCYRGADIAGWPSHKVCDLGIGQVAEGRQVFPTLSVAENLDDGRDAAARARRARAQPRAGLRAVSGAGRAPRPGGRHAVGRRAADAGDRPLPDGRAGTGDVRRALARPCAGDRAERAADACAISTARG